MVISEKEGMMEVSKVEGAETLADVESVLALTKAIEKLYADNCARRYPQKPLPADQFAQQVVRMAGDTLRPIFTRPPPSTLPCEEDAR